MPNIRLFRKTTLLSTGEDNREIHDVEKCTGGSGDDYITGNALDNMITGGGGNDTLTGVTEMMFLSIQEIKAVTQ